MLKNYLLVSFRNLLRNKLFSFINILGLSIGIGAALLIFNYLQYEEGYDKFHSNFNRIYRVPMQIQEKGGPVQTFAFTYPAVAGAMKNDFPEVEEAIRFRRLGGLVNVEDKAFADVKMFFADEKVFDVFTFPFLYGEANALKELNNAVITEALALKLFGEVDARGRTFQFFDNQIFKVSAVIKNIPENSHIQFDFLLPYKRYSETLKEVGADAETNWGWSDYYTYVLLKPNQDPVQVQGKMAAFAERYKGEDMKARGYSTLFQLQPLSDIHTKSAYDYELIGNGNFTYLSYLLYAALFILLMAWFNYVNLSTSKSLQRAKEVGIRKTAGAHRLELVVQFLIDSLVVNVIAVVVGVMIFMIANPYLAALTGKSLIIPSYNDFEFWVIIICALLAGSLLSGFYPAFVLSGFKPINALKGKLTASSASATYLRKALVVVQISLAVILLSGTWALITQMRFMQNQNLGVNINQTLVLRDRGDRDSTYAATDESFIQELKRLSFVKSVTASADVPGREVGGSDNYQQVGLDNPKRCRMYEVDLNFFHDYELKMLAGRSFERHDQKGQRVVINQTAATVLGFASAESAINTKITDGRDTLTVVGVLQDFHQKSLQHDFNPIVFFLEDYGWGYYSVKLSSADIGGGMVDIEKLWKQFYTETPFDYFFLDEFYNAQYKSEQMFNALLNVCTGIGIVIAGLGLVGLSLFTIARRTKEMGVRKVLGASVAQVVNLFVKEYVLLAVLAFFVAMPLSYYMAASWLQSYAFRTTLGISFFVAPFAGILLVTLISVGVQSFIAAGTNPTKSLRSE